MHNNKRTTAHEARRFRPLSGACVASGNQGDKGTSIALSPVQRRQRSDVRSLSPGVSLEREEPTLELDCAGRTNVKASEKSEQTPPGRSRPEVAETLGDPLRRRPALADPVKRGMVQAPLRRASLLVSCSRAAKPWLLRDQILRQGLAI